jgi:hypothetical protein
MFTVLNGKKSFEFESRTLREAKHWIGKNAPHDRGDTYYIQEDGVIISLPRSNMI